MNSIFLAKLLGLYCLIVSVGVLLDFDSYRKMLADIKSGPFMYLAGVFALWFGLWLVLSHNVWRFDWRVIITLMGWLGLLKGITIIVFPATAIKMTEYHLQNPQMLKGRLYVLFAFGVILTLVGFFR